MKRNREANVIYSNELSEWLETFSWNYFVTFTTRYELTLPSARRLMERFHDRTTKDLPLFPQTLFWVAEKFECKDGYHTHGLLQTEMPFKSIIEHYQIVSAARKQKDWAGIELRPYVAKIGAERYCSKYVLKECADYDFKIHTGAL